ncbi:MAG: aldose epimerase family protein [Gemmatimonadaceae bacterium]
MPVARTRVTRQPFGATREGQPVEAFTFSNARGFEVRVITYGGIIVSLRAPDRVGRLDDIVLGFDTLDGYLGDSPYFGAIVGRYGNRIAGGCFTLDGTTYQLATNDGAHHLHGGARGFDKVVWKAEPFDGPGGAGVVLTHTSPDGDQGYPGTLIARVTYALTDRDELVVDYHATTDRPTHVNLTQHTYFNLAGAGAREVLDHELAINASRYTPVDVTLIPTGELAPVDDTPFDFREPRPLGARIDRADEQLWNGRGYDHNFVLDRDGSALTLAARVREPDTGRVLDVYTTEPGLQLYSGNFLGQAGAGVRGKAGRTYGARYGFSLETQHFPDSPNKAHFPTTVLRPGAEYRSRTVFAFGARS